MKTNLAIIVSLTATLFLAGCNASLEDMAPKAAERPLPTHITRTMQAKGMAKQSPIMVRIFKDEGELEVWKQTHTGRFDLVTTYEICKWSGKLGPKFTEGDRQAPEGFYSVRPHQMNPNSSYHLSFNIGFPNAFDRANSRSGSHLMVHGDCSSAGCYSMTDGQMEEIYAFAREAFRGGQTEFQVQAFPFRMTAENMARYKGDSNYDFWQMLKEGYDHFEITRVPPRVNVCNRRYVFNQQAENGSFTAAAACPPMNQPESLQTAYRSFQTTFDAAFQSALGNGAGTGQRSPTIAGMEEAVLVADWSRRRARGESVTAQPPSLERGPTVVAAAPAPVAAPQPVAAPEAVSASRPAASPEPVAASEERQLTETTSTLPASASAYQAEPETTGTVSRGNAGGQGGLNAIDNMRSRLSGGIRNLFGG